MAIKNACLSPAALLLPQATGTWATIHSVEDLAAEALRPDLLPHQTRFEELQNPAADPMPTMNYPEFASSHPAERSLGLAGRTAAVRLRASSDASIVDSLVISDV
jgi:hypothetical protein